MRDPSQSSPRERFPGKHEEPEFETSDHVEAVEERAMEWVRRHGGGGLPFHDPDIEAAFINRLHLLYGLKHIAYFGVSTTPERMFESPDGSRLAVFSVRDEVGSSLLPERRIDVLTDYENKPEWPGVLLEDAVAPMKIALWAETGEARAAKLFPILSDPAFHELDLHKSQALLRLKAARYADPYGGYPVKQPSFMVFLMVCTVAEAVKDRVTAQNPEALPYEWTPTRIDDIEPCGKDRYRVTVSVLREESGHYLPRPESHEVKLSYNPFYGTLERSWEGLVER